MVVQRAIRHHLRVFELQLWLRALEVVGLSRMSWSEHRRAARLVIIQPALPEYRLGFFTALAEGWPGEVVVAHGADLPGCAVTDTRPGPYRRIELPWHRTRVGLQLDWPSVSRLVDDAAVVIVPGDPHALVAHRLLAIRRLGGRRPVIALSQFRGADARWLPSLVKPWWHRAFDGLILYTRREAEHYLALGHSPERLTWLDNGLARLPPAATDDELEGRRRSGPLVCLGRHVGKNRFDLVVEAFREYRRTGGQRRLLFIGAGPETAALRLQAADLAEVVEFAGPVYEADRLDAYLRGAAAVVHPLAMGLSINTAFGYGLPVIACADHRRHMPEFWVWQQGVTGEGFVAKPGQEAAAIPALCAALRASDTWDASVYSRMAQAARAAVEPLTTGAMAERVLGLCHTIHSRTR